MEKLKAIELAAYLDVRNELLALEAIRHEAGRSLDELHRGRAPHFNGEEDLAWAALEYVCQNLPAAATAYTIVSFANFDLRTRFVLDPAERPAMVADILEAGGVVGPRGQFFEVAL